MQVAFSCDVFPGDTASLLPIETLRSDSDDANENVPDKQTLRRFQLFAIILTYSFKGRKIQVELKGQI